MSWSFIPEEHTGYGTGRDTVPVGTWDWARHGAGGDVGLSETQCRWGRGIGRDTVAVGKWDWARHSGGGDVGLGETQ
jgi:hypothetical protein